MIYLYKLYTVLPFLLQFLCRIRLFKAFAAGVLSQRILTGSLADATLQSAFYTKCPNYRLNK
jgi:hypothetical protein